MEYNEKLYNIFSKGEERLESWMGAVFSKEYDHELSIDEVEEIFSEASEFMVLDLKKIDKEEHVRQNSKWEILVRLQYLPMVLDEDEEHECCGGSCGCHENNEDEEDHKCKCSNHSNNINEESEEHDNESSEESNEKSIDELTFYIALVDAISITKDVPEIFSIKTVTEEKYNEACQCKYAVHIATKFENFHLTDYQRQLQLLDHLVPDASLFLDMSCYTAHSGDWLSYTSTFSLPPSLDYLYSIHAVYDDDKDPNKIEYWFHTHGLYRVGSIELEIVGVEDSDAHYGELLNTCAKLFIERGVPKAGFEFNPAYNVYVCWFPWQEALKKLNISDDISGSSKDRNDGVHNTPSGILTAVDSLGNYHAPSFYKKELTENPMFMMSNFETHIMREAAYEKIGHFLELLNSREELEKKYGKDDVGFLVKLGYGENEEEDDSCDLEHLWFDINSFTNEGYFDAVLLNEPYKNLGMHEGDRGMHSIERLTDWAIYLQGNQFNSRNIYLLY